MTALLATRLPHRGRLRISGAEALAFLDRLVTIEASHIADGAAGFAALLSPQGKILADFFLFRLGDEVILDCPRAVLPDLLKRLTMYRLRAAISLTDISGDTDVMVLWTDDGSSPAVRPAGALAVATDPRLAALGLRAIVPAGTDLPGDAVPATPEDWAAHRVVFGVPESGIDFTPGDAFPHDADMDDLNGVDFTKGCFVGQEVVSRMKHRGTARRRVIRVSATEPLPPTGTPVLAGDRSAGTLGTVSGAEGLALLRLDRVKAALDAGEPVTADGVALTPELPGFARFVWPEDSSGA